MPPAAPHDSASRPSTTLVRRARKMDRVLAETYPGAGCELDFTDPFELLVATVMSAQTTDRRVNAVTPELFRRYPTPADLAAADRTTVEEIIRSTGFFRAKTDSLLRLSAARVEQFAGRVPGRLDQLVTLPGVGRKTANVVLGNAFDVPGITVDTHVARVRVQEVVLKHYVNLGVDAGTPIINPGESAILCFGAVRNQPWVVSSNGVDEIVPARSRRSRCPSTTAASTARRGRGSWPMSPASWRTPPRRCSFDPQDAQFAQVWSRTACFAQISHGRVTTVTFRRNTWTCNCCSPSSWASPPSWCWCSAPGSMPSRRC